MIIKEILEQLKTSETPIARALHSSIDNKVLIIGFNAKMILKEHKSHHNSKMVVIRGSVIYKEVNGNIKLFLHDEVDIPARIEHSIEAIEDSLCLLIQF